MSLRSTGSAETLAHGFGSRQDLPIPLELAVTGAGLAVGVSFLISAVFWKRSHLRGGLAGRELPRGLYRFLDARALRIALRLVGLAGTGFFLVAAARGAPDPMANPATGIIYVLFWVGLVPLSLLFGPVWKLLSPLRSIHLLMARLAGVRPEQEIVRMPRWIGYWPAALGLLAFAWLELVSPGGDQPRVLLTFFCGYGALNLVAAGFFGSRWFERGEAFEVYSTLIGRLAPIGRREDGKLVLRNPFDGLDGLRPESGLVAVVCVWLGTTAYDGFSRSNLWSSLLTDHALGLEPVVLETIAFAVIIGLTAGLFAACTAGATILGTGERKPLPRQFSHSLVPIAVGYTVAHYFSLLVFEGQRTFALASDPLDTGADYFGTASVLPDYAAVSVSAIAIVQVSSVVSGHVLGVVAAHDRAARLFPRRQAIAGQLPLLVLMITYTIGGLALLFAE